MRRRPARWSVAAQLLVLQLVVLLGALGGVLWLSVGQSLRTFEAQEGRRTLSAAETLAATPLVRALASVDGVSRSEALLSAVESVRSVAGLTETALTDAAGTVIASSDPTRTGEPAPAGMLAGDLARAWTGTAELSGRQTLLSRVPVLDDDGALMGFATASRDLPAWPERLQDAVPDLLVTLAVFATIGVGGSYLLSRRLKRQTRGMEPGEITALVEHREALIDGVKEGVVAVDREQRLTALNDAARDLLGWHGVAEGQHLRDTPAPAAVLLALAPSLDAGDDDAVDVPLVVGERMLVVNRRPIRSRERIVGAVTTLRDRTELVALEDALDASRTTTDLLRAQAHEFANQMHTVSGLIQADAGEEALRYVSGIALTRSAMLDAVSEQIADAPLAALLIAKSTVATERRVRLALDEDAHLDPVSPALSHDLITVTGNLVDNALDAVAGRPDAEVDVDVRDADGVVTIVVQDSGPGLAGTAPELLFQRGFSTKQADAPGGRGYGLSLTQRICRLRGGDVSVADADDDGGAVFTAVLPREGEPAR
ncbi:ATP-binding protein [Microbacterium sp. NPDC091313]